MLSIYSVSLRIPKINVLYYRNRVAAGGLMVSALDSAESIPGSSPGRVCCVVFLGKTLYSHSSYQVYKWVLANIILGVTL